jgi:hypothetical protein
MLYKDVIYSILLHLEVPTLLVVARVCRLFALMAKEDNLWRRFNEGGGSRQFLSSLYQLKAAGKVEFSFTGAEKRIHKGKCRDLCAAMGRDLKCLVCQKTVRMTPAYWRANKFVHYYDDRVRVLRFCCAACTGTSLLCHNCDKIAVACTEEELRGAVGHSMFHSNEVRCKACSLHCF